MALIACPECTGQVSDQSPQCVHCGFPLIIQTNAVAAHPQKTRLLTDNPNYQTHSMPVRAGLLDGNPNYDIHADQLQRKPYQGGLSYQVIKTSKSRGVYIILGLFFGFFGVHNYYAGYIGRGFAQLLLTLGVLVWFMTMPTQLWPILSLIVALIWVAIDFVTINSDSAGDRMV